MRYWILSVLLLFFPFFAYSNDCVPLAFEQLSILIHHPVSYNVWRQELIKNGNLPDVEDMYLVWNKKFPDNSLYAIWQSPYIKSQLIINEIPTDFHRPYIWVGEEIDGLVDKKDNQANCHCSLLFFESSKVILISPLKPQNVDPTAIFAQELSYEEFYRITFFVFAVNLDNK